MKTLMKIALVISILNIPAFGSCLIKMDHESGKYNVMIWKHVEDKEDTVTSKSFTESDLSEINPLISQHKGIKIVFNEGVFTSMKYVDGSSKRWSELSNGEKDMIFFIQEKFNVKETLM